MEEKPTGTCKHGTFILADGCAQCTADRIGIEGNTEASIAEEITAVQPKVSQTDIVKVQYKLDWGEGYRLREYTYYSYDRLCIGDIVIVPVRDTTTKARVSTIDVPEEEIARFKDSVETIPSDSIIQEEEPVVTRETIAKATDDMNQAFDHLCETEAIQATAIVKIAPGKDEAVVALYNEGKKLQGYAEARVIKTQDDMKAATEDQLAITGTKKSLLEVFNGFTEPIRTHLNEVLEVRKRFTEPFLNAETINKTKMTAYLAEVKRKAQEAEETNRMAQEVAHRQAEQSGTGEFTVDTTPVEVIPAPKLTRTQSGSAGLLDVWKYRVTDINLVPREYMIEDSAMLNSIAKKHHDAKAVPGIEFYNEPTMRTYKPK